MDLTQAESVMDLITARTNRGRALALAGVKGDLSKELGSLRTDLIDLLSSLESEIDFDSEDISHRHGTVTPDDIGNNIARIDRLLGRSGGRLVRDGITVVITGRPNVGSLAFSTHSSASGAPL
jgi:tRNA modification GTPase